MAQVLQMDSNFPGQQCTPAPPPSLLGKEDLPYSVETPYGYRLDLDFLKYVSDIEKGHTLKKVPGQRRSRLGSLPRASGYTGSWWTSTESLCSNGSADSRRSSYSCCAPGYHGSRAPFSLSAARVEKTLLDARRRLEEERERQARRPSNLGSMRGSVAGSTSSLSSAQGLARVGSSSASGLSTPVSPSPAHLQHVREQMSLALRKIRELEEQVKTIPVLQVKISVLQEEKRQLSVQLKSQKFLGHTLGFGRARGHQGELYIHIPEDEAPPPVSPAPTPTSPAPTPTSPAPTPTSPAPTVGPGGGRGVRSVGVGPEAEGRSREVGVGVQERDLGLLPEAELLRSRVGQLETSLQELRARRGGGGGGGPLAEQAIRATSVGWQEEPLGGAPAATPLGLRTMVSFTQQPRRQEQQEQRGQREQRSVGIQVYTLEQPVLMRAERCRSPPPVQNGPLEAESPSARPITVCSRQLHGVLHRTEVSSSVPVSTPGAEMLNTAELRSSRGPRREGSPQQPQTASQSHASASQPARLECPLWPAVEQEAESEASSLSTKQGLQLSSAPTGCESSSSEESSSESSEEEESDASEYHEATERLPESPAHRPHEGPNSAIQSPSTISAPKQGAIQSPSTISAPKQGAIQSPSTISAPKQGAIQSPSTISAPKQGAIQSPSTVSAPKQGAIQSPSTISAPKQGAIQSQSTVSAPKQGVTQSQSTVSAPKQGVTQSPSSYPPLKTQEAPGKDGSTPSVTQEARLQLSDNLMAALRLLQKALVEPALFSQQGAKTAYSAALQDWLRVSCHRTADARAVRSYMEAFSSLSPQLLHFVVNMADGNGNTALHYTVSHSNFPVVKLLLDTGLCDADRQNKAGYTAIMLTALAAFHSDSDLHTVLQLLRSGDVNAKASQAGQTALMLAVSHGRGDMVRALLSCGAQVNIRDEDGSTALMCACEHGHVDIVRQLLSVPGCDATITDNDGSTALSIALEACQNDIAVLLYAHLNFAKPPSPVSPKAHQLGTSPPPAGERK
ncbi:hypothetical protein AAFF_G00356010 [Aldrovandia affinis]|uniref:KN motif and ankyrin repeat domain-containing protein 2 n=1 Tax=Aldrovandia affinis TaxID=143900 RepID=A0AAD7R5D7_9TELE|nr:hypothetical protein AAFF_G00356010 [Aldrovandia affinis]